MSWLGLPLALLAGGTLGAFGAGGSILLVPILVYVVGVPAGEAVATSLLVVGVTSAVALLTHARGGHVRWRIGGLFGAAAMLGAYAGGRLAEQIPGPVLLAAFAVLMVAAAVAMLRVRNAGLAAPTPDTGRVRWLPALALGAGVGLIAGLVGAGGGFLVVPVLVLLGGLGIHSAVATSLLVVAMQSFAGLAGHVSHVELDWSLSAVVAAFTIAGSTAGSRFAARLPAARLHRAFAWLVAVVGGVMLAMQVPDTWVGMALSSLSPLAPLLGGALLGLAAALLWLLNGRVAGISGIAGGLLQAGRGDRLWRVLFVAGLALGGLVMNLWVPSAFEAATASPGLVLVAGLLVGLGTTLGNGCTSGHGVCGVSRLSARSLTAVGVFMMTGMLTVHAVRHVLGGIP
jgi:uncharacterized membrane protein YfcA/uncharacterized membrane protein YedE/YeeE